jgi:glycosyltransferase involved in cell wall biosynthesis
LWALKPDVVHAHLPLAMMAIATSRGKGDQIRIATHHHGDHFIRSGNGLAAHADHLAGRRFDVIVAPSESVREFLIERYGYSRPRIVTIRNGWGRMRPTSAPVKRAPLPTIVSVANFRAQKNHELLVHAFALVHGELPEVRLLLVGDGPLKQHVQNLTVSLGVENRVDFAGYVEDVWPYLLQSRLFAIASRYEPLGIAVLEAMAAGLPVVAPAIGGLREIVTPGVTGALVEPGDATAMAVAMVEILRSEAATAAMGASARRAAQAYTADTMIDGYFSLYRELLAQGNAPDKRLKRPR